MVAGKGIETFFTWVQTGDCRTLGCGWWVFYFHTNRYAKWVLRHQTCVRNSRMKTYIGLSKNQRLSAQSLWWTPQSLIPSRLYLCLVIVICNGEQHRLNIYKNATFDTWMEQKLVPRNRCQMSSNQQVENRTERMFWYREFPSCPLTCYNLTPNACSSFPFFLLSRRGHKLQGTIPTFRGSGFNIENSCFSLAARSRVGHSQKNNLFLLTTGKPRNILYISLKRSIKWYTLTGNSSK